MEINYEIIIKHLCGKNTNTNTKFDKKNPIKNPNPFVTQKNIYTYANTFPESFGKIFNEKFYRYGVTVSDNEHNNISFWSSLMTLLDKNFIIPYTSDEIPMINQFKTQLINSYDKSNLSEFIKKLDKNDIKERFKLNPDLIVIQYISDVLDLNIWIFDFKLESIHVVYPKDIMNPWKQSILLATHGINWEPIMCLKSKGNVTRLFDYNNGFLKQLIESDGITYLNGSDIGKEYIYIDNINDIIKQEKQNLGIGISKLSTENSNNDSESSVQTIESDKSNETNKQNNYFIKADELEEIKKINKTKMNKMKIAELTELANKLKIQMPKKTPTKAILMELIIQKITQA